MTTILWAAFAWVIALDRAAITFERVDRSVARLAMICARILGLALYFVRFAATVFRFWVTLESAWARVFSRATAACPRLMAVTAAFRAVAICC